MAFGILESKFRILQGTMPSRDTEFAENIFLACTCLHDFCNKKRKFDCELEIDIFHDDDSDHCDSDDESASGSFGSEHRGIYVVEDEQCDEVEDRRRDRIFRVAMQERPESPSAAGNVTLQPNTTRRTALMNELCDHFLLDEEREDEFVRRRRRLRRRRLRERLRARNRRKVNR